MENAASKNATLSVVNKTRRMELCVACNVISQITRCRPVVAFFSGITTLSLTNRPRVRGRFDAVLVYDVSLLKEEDTPGKIKARQRQPSIQSLLLFLPFALSLPPSSRIFHINARRVEGGIGLGTSYH